MFSAAQLPLQSVRRVYRYVRSSVFNKPRPTGEYVSVNTRRLSLERRLGRLSYAPNWETSYYKRGEDVNLARVMRVDSPKHPDVRWWQVHVRGWKQDDDTVELTAHWEPEPTENPKAHLDGVGASVSAGMDALCEDLREMGVEYTEFEYEG